MKKLLSVLTLLVLILVALCACGGGEECLHENLMLPEGEPTRTRSAITHCNDCGKPDTRVTLPPLTDESFYEIEYIDEDTSIARCEVLGKKFEFYSTNFIFDFEPDGANITGYTVIGYTGTSTTVTIPKEYNDNRNGKLPVKYINWDPSTETPIFSNTPSVKEVIIPEGVESIGFRAFEGSSSIEKITFPESLKTIEDRAFNGCSSLTTIVIPNGVGTVGDGAFLGCNAITSVTLPKIYNNRFAKIFGDDNGNSENVPASLTKVILTSEAALSDGAFAHCRYIKAIILPDTLTSIGSGAFSNCEALESLVLPGAVTSIGDYCFDGTSIECIYFNGEKSDFLRINANLDKNPLIKEGDVLYYMEEEPSALDFIRAGKLVWHYDENGVPSAWDIDVEITTTLLGKSCIYESTRIVVSDEYWYMLSEAKSQGMLDVVLDPETLVIYNNSIDKASFEILLTASFEESYALLTVKFEDRKTTLYQNGQQLSYPTDYLEINGEIVYYPGTDKVAYTVEDGKLVEDASNEYITVIHPYSIPQE